MTVFPKTLAEYAHTYLADILLPLPESDRDGFLRTLAIGYMGGPYPSRLLVQRLVEVSVGTISSEQYRAWVIRDDESGASCVAHVLKSLADGFLVGGDRGTMLAYLSNSDISNRDARLVLDAGAAGLLTEREARDALKQALLLAPLPAVRPLPEGIEPLPVDYPEPRREFPFDLSPPGTATPSR